MISSPPSGVPPAPGDVTQLLRRWSDGDARAADTVLPLVYREMRRVAGALARGERDDHTLPPTAVVHEAWIQLVGRRGIQFPEFAWQSRGHFLAVAARAMRRVLVDHARRRNRAKRGGGGQREEFAEGIGATPPASDELLALHLALERLENFAPLDAQVVELRFFGGLTLEETADHVGSSRRTVVRVWRRARAWLAAELSEGR